MLPPRKVQNHGEPPRPHLCIPRYHTGICIGVAGNRSEVIAKLKNLDGAVPSWCDGSTRSLSVIVSLIFAIISCQLSGSRLSVIVSRV